MSNTVAESLFSAADESQLRPSLECAQICRDLVSFKGEVLQEYLSHTHTACAARVEPKLLQRASYLEYGVRSLRGRLQQPPPKAPKAQASLSIGTRTRVILTAAALYDA